MPHSCTLIRPTTPPGYVAARAESTFIALCCPACGRQRELAASREFPAGLARIVAPCPSCGGHGRAASVLVFHDGHVEQDKPG